MKMRFLPSAKYAALKIDFVPFGTLCINRRGGEVKYKQEKEENSCSCQEINNDKLQKIRQWKF